MLTKILSEQCHERRKRANGEDSDRGSVLLKSWKWHSQNIHTQLNGSHCNATKCTDRFFLSSSVVCAFFSLSVFGASVPFVVQYKFLFLCLISCLKRSLTRYLCFLYGTRCSIRSLFRVERTALARRLHIHNKVCKFICITLSLLLDFYLYFYSVRIGIIQVNPAYVTSTVCVRACIYVLVHERIFTL